MRLRLFLISLLLFISFVKGWSQNFVGYSKNEVVQMIREKLPEFNEDNTVTKKAFNYLKYVDNSGYRTFMFFFNDNDTCTFTKMMYDYLYIDDVKNYNNKYFTEVDKNSWSFLHKGIQYSVELDEGEWFFTVLTKRKE